MRDPPTEPIEIDMNESLHFKFIDRDNIFVTFRAPEEGLVHTFDCSRKFAVPTRTSIMGSAQHSSRARLTSLSRLLV